MPRLPLRNFQTCLSFPGANTAYALCKSGVILAGQTNASISAYIKTSQTILTPIYCERAASGNDIFKLELGVGHALRLTYRDDGGTLNQPGGTKVINDNVWHHVVLTKSGTTIKFYVDGGLDGSASLTASNTFTNSGIEARIGGDKGDGTVFFSGLIDEVTLWNIALSQTDVQNIYNPGLYQSSGLISQYLFNEGSGSVINDQQGTNNGTIQGAVTYSSSVIPATTRTLAT